MATEEFARFGLSGARVARIAKRTSTSKRMIYYYFGGKEALYRAVLESAYLGIRAIEAKLNLEELAPADAIRALVALTFDYEDTHPEFINLVSMENLNKARFLSKDGDISAINSGIIQRLDGILRRGQVAGVFRKDLNTVDVHMMISAVCFFRVSNQYTFQALFKRNFSDLKVRALHKQMACDAIVRLLAP